MKGISGLLPLVTKVVGWAAAVGGFLILLRPILLISVYAGSAYIFLSFVGFLLESQAFTLFLSMGAKDQYIVVAVCSLVLIFIGHVVGELKKSVRIIPLRDK